jgi:hypothetical protein
VSIIEVQQPILGAKIDTIIQHSIKQPFQYGVIAEEVEKAIPSAISLSPNGFKTVDYAQLVAIMLAKINELEKEINLLKK